jgi:hypothetical protein
VKNENEIILFAAALGCCSAWCASGSCPEAPNRIVQQTV